MTFKIRKTAFVFAFMLGACAAAPNASPPQPPPPPPPPVAPASTAPPAPTVEAPAAPPFSTKLVLEPHRRFAKVLAEITNASDLRRCLVFRTDDPDADLAILDPRLGGVSVRAVFPLSKRPPRTCLAPGETVTVTGRLDEVYLPGCPGNELEVSYSASPDAVGRVCPSCWTGSLLVGRAEIPPSKDKPCP